ncbi:MAG: hypothetical protein MH204_09370 [Fimbriimonadaceae bacterium]|nr:hypothetical protein [Fimbriimonadaceae bacterium]
MARYQVWGWLPIGALGLTLLACGGGGGGASLSAGDVVFLGTANNPDGLRLELIDGTDRGPIDPYSLQPGSRVQVVAARYTAGVRTELTPTGLSIGGATSAQASLDSQGRLTIGTPAPSGIFTLTGNAGGGSLSMRLSAASVAGSTRVRGRVSRNGFSAGPLKFIELELVNAADQVIGGALTNGSGDFNLAIPAGGAAFSIRASSVDTAAYHLILRYQSRYYAADAAGCGIPLPTTTPGGTASLPSDLVLQVKSDAGPPPPPPNCLGL